MYDEYFTEEHHIFRATVRKFIEKEIKPHIEHWDEEGEFPIELYKKFADQGLMGLTYPAEYGGTPCDIFMYVIYTEEMVRGTGSVGLVSGLGSNAIAMPPVLKLGTEAQKQKFLVPVLAGEKIAALALRNLTRDRMWQTSRHGPSAMETTTWSTVQKLSLPAAAGQTSLQPPCAREVPATKVSASS